MATNPAGGGLCCQSDKGRTNGHPTKAFDRHRKIAIGEERGGCGRRGGGGAVGRAFGTTAHGFLTGAGIRRSHHSAISSGFATAAPPKCPP